MVRKLISESKRLAASLTTLNSQVSNLSFWCLRTPIDLQIEGQAKTESEMAEAGENTPLIPETRDGPAAGGSGSLLQHG